MVSTTEDLNIVRGDSTWFTYRFLVVSTAAAYGFYNCLQDSGFVGHIYILGEYINRVFMSISVHFQGYAEYILSSLTRCLSNRRHNHDSRTNPLLILGD